MRNRFGQGTARYHYLGPFRILRPHIGRPVEVNVAYQFLKVILGREPDWALFPLSRKQVASHHLGSFNKVLCDLMTLPTGERTWSPLSPKR